MFSAHPGGRFRDYKIKRTLSHTEHTDVFEAAHIETGQVVALKLIRSVPNTREWIKDEIRGAKLQKLLAEYEPGVADVYDYSSQFDFKDDYFYIVMEYVEGEDLSEKIKEGPVPPFDAAKIITQVCEVLERAHNFEGALDTKPFRGIIHGDIKPTNIRIKTDDIMKILDFGIAKDLAISRQLTSNVFGSDMYCSPERLETDEVDINSDLWSVGVLLYEMVVGALPFQGTTVGKLIESMRSGPPSRAWPDHCPETLRRIILKMFAPVVSQRYPSAAALKADLKAFLANKKTVAQIDSPIDYSELTRRTVRPGNDEAHTHRTSGKHQTAQGAHQTAQASPPSEQAGAQAAQTRQEDSVASAQGSAPEGPTSRFKKGWIVFFVLLILVLLGANEVVVANHASELQSELETEKWKNKDMTEPISRYEALCHRSIRGSLGFLPVRLTLKQKLVEFGDNVISDFRKLQKVFKPEWERARDYLERAFKLDTDDALAKAKWLYCKGHIDRIEGDTLFDKKKTKEADEKNNAAEDNFEDAASAQPEWADPHIGLAILYVYNMRDEQKALDMVDNAEKLQNGTNPLTIAIRGDCLRARAHRLYNKANELTGIPQDKREVLGKAKADCDKAKSLYMSLLPFKFPFIKENLRLVNLTLDNIQAQVEVINKLEADAALAKATEVKPPLPKMVFPR
jgi:serine/threonine protein kinase